VSCRSGTSWSHMHLLGTVLAYVAAETRTAYATRCAFTFIEPCVNRLGASRHVKVAQIREINSESASPAGLGRAEVCMSIAF